MTVESNTNSKGTVDHQTETATARHRACSHCTQHSQHTLQGMHPNVQAFRLLENISVKTAIEAVKNKS